VLNNCMKALGIRIELAVAQWPENLKAARSGNFQVWSVGGSSAAPDSEGAFQKYDSRQIGGQNMGRVRLPALDKAYDRIQTLPDGPERLAAFREAERLGLAYMPYKYILNRVSLDMTQRRVVGYRRPVFWQDWWHFVDIDDGADTVAKKA
jgi:ABC-type transport system substrate-binding protein